jgi:branched-chain amino acid transport system substrate-binding protein
MPLHKQIVLPLFALAVVLAVGCSEERLQPSGDVVKIGVIGPFSGPDQAVGESGMQGVELAIELQPLLDNGDRIELVKLDDRSLPESCHDAYDQMDDLNIAGVLVLSRSSSVLALSPRARLHRIPIIATIASHPELTETNPHLIQLTLDDAFQGAAAAMFLRDEMFLRRGAIIGEPTDIHARALADEFAAQFKSANGTIVDYLPLSGDGTNITATLAAWQQHDVEFIYAPVQAHRLLQLMRALRSLDWNPAVMAGDGALAELSLEYPTELGLAEGMLATDLYGGKPQRTTFGQKLHELYKDSGEESGSIFTVLGGEGTALLIHALNRTPPGYASQAVQRQLRLISGFEAYGGALSVGSDGKVIRPVDIGTIKQGQLKSLVRVY